VGFFDGVTANLIRSGRDGGRYYAPFGRRGAIYRVPDDGAAARIAREWRTFSTVVFGVVVVAPLTGLGWQLFLLTPIVVIAVIPFAFYTGRGLPRATLGFDELIPVTQSEALDRYARAVGRGWSGFLLAASVGMTALGIFAAVMSRRAELWLGALFFALCTVSLYVQYRRAGPGSRP
jgi:hypothetical protein